MSQEVVAAGKVRTAAETAALEKWGVKANALPSDATLNVGLRLLPQRRSKHGIEVVQDGAVRLPESINILVSAPGGLRAYAKVPLKKEVSAEGRISASANILRKMIDVRACI